MASPWLTIPGGLLLLYIGASGLVRGSTALSLRLGLTPLVVGLTVVAFGTSSPELVVSLSAAATGDGSIAVGNVVGSNIANIALILGIMALIYPARAQLQLVRIDIPVVIGATAIVLLMLLNGTLGFVEGAVLTTGIIGYTGFQVWYARKHTSKQANKLMTQSGTLASDGSPLWEAAMVVGGLLLLVLGAHLLVQGAITVATQFAVPEAIVGLTIVAIGTSLPELATSTVAALRGQTDLAVGNLVGSNAFNLMGVLGPTALVQPLSTAGIDAVSLGVMMFTALLILPLARSGFVINRLEAAFLLIVYAGYIGYLAAITL